MEDALAEILERLLLPEQPGKNHRRQALFPGVEVAGGNLTRRQTGKKAEALRVV